MTVDDPRARLARNLAGAPGHKPVAGAVEAVPAQGVPFVILIGQGVDIRLGLHTMPKDGVEHGHLRRGRT